MILGIVSGALLGAGVLLAVPVATFAGECLVGGLGGAPIPRTAPRPAGARAVVLIPAHDEASGIAGTLSKLLPEISADDEILVVADNCSDNTASIARACGATVIERNDRTERGKGFALSFGIDYLEKRGNKPDVVIVLDADCVFRAGSVNALVAAALAHQSPVQSEYELDVPSDADSKSRIGGFAFRVKNTLRPRGLSKLGCPRQLAGTGMAFPWEVLRDAPNMRGHITEDLVLGLELAMRGKAPRDCPEARVESPIAPSEGGHAAQRKRWETGHLQAIRQYVPKLLLSAIRAGRIDELALACDLSVPPLALLVVMTGTLTGLSVATALLGGSAAASYLLGAEMVLLASGVIVAWRSVGRQVLPFRELLAVPWYVAAKLPTYVGLALGRGNLGWVRAERK